MAKWKTSNKLREAKTSNWVRTYYGPSSSTFLVLLSIMI